MADLEYSRADAVATILLNRPERKNAFTLQMVRHWADALHEAAKDDQVRAVVVRGAGGAFCSGIDLDELTSVDPAPLSRRRVLTDQVHRVARALEDLDKPVIAAVQGTAVGAGLDMALMCDIRLVGESARLSEGYIHAGLIPGDGGCLWLPRLVGVARALELLLTGDVVDGPRAERIGLANHCYPDGELLTRTYELAARLAALPPVAVGFIKRATYESLHLDARTHLNMIASHMAVVQSTEDSAATLAALRAKRKTGVKRSEPKLPE
ncbi:enoyl-CoA hydratase/isomerase family protein [Prauserella muralis]|uniref:Enoyl-CoA hydratase n=1 Tax=Prauserella muralis TaxID=588067 RepID=A0A2V4AE44_9PSEU|nr:enoyl-CoA hydratase-related protein [Prauserella muralis]PXY17377.1 enoyl-CoA hydratase [Prauserella muralis]TWE23539.1 enoyl-CoA hydratase/carnithine racemase [Prauserella muralis]